MQQTEQQRLNKDVEDQEVHVYCPGCYPDNTALPFKALCGSELKEEKYTTDPATCVVCIDLDNEPCEFCGY